METYNQDLSSAISDFRSARNQAGLKELLARLKGESTQLLSYDEVRRQLKAWGWIECGVKDIPLDAIVGSVGRYTDFTRDFLPLGDVNPERWARVKVAASGLVGLPPIEVYQIGETYFVQDGNHRVSVARQLGALFIQAYVTEVQIRVPLTPDVQPDDLILIAEYADFLEQTRLNELKPGADLHVSIPGQYPTLSEHIDVHRYYMGLELERDIPYPEVVGHWYDNVYMPVVEIIRKQGILRDFPGRTETDLYLWIAEHRAQIEEELGWQIKTEYAISHIAEQHGPERSNFFARVGEKIVQVILPDTLESGPPAGQWRAQTLAARRPDRLFTDLLVPVDGKEGGWCALDQALVVAERESAQIHGLFVLPGVSEMESESALALKDEFDQRCQNAGITGQLIIDSGEIARQISDRAAWTDLVVVNLTYPPGPQPLARLSSGFRDLIQRCPRPILATPQTVSQLKRALVAYDGSPKAREALFIAAYLFGQWKIPLVVVSVSDSEQAEGPILTDARNYLESHGVQADYQMLSGAVGEAILKAADAQECDFIVMGGYGFSPVWEVVLGSALDQVLRESSKPILICR